jgi:endo-1,4-beta-xylanase
MKYLRNYLSLVLFFFGIFEAVGTDLHSNISALREFANIRGILFGSAENLGDSKSNASYLKELGQQYSLVTAENSCKWGAIQAKRGHFDFSECDSIFDLAQNASQTFRGHNLCWGVHNPSWLSAINSPAELGTELISYIKTVLVHYGPQATFWDVVNEAISDGIGVFKSNTWYPAMKNYVDVAFSVAGQSRSPGVLLFYNDYNFASSTGWTATKSQKVSSITLATGSARGHNIDIVCSSMISTPRGLT